MPGSEVIILWQGRRHFGGWPLKGPDRRRRHSLSVGFTDG